MPRPRTITMQASDLPNTQPGQHFSVHGPTAGEQVVMETRLLLLEDGKPTAILVAPVNRPEANLILRTG